MITRRFLIGIGNLRKNCIKARFMFNFFRKSFNLWDDVEKYGTAAQATDGNIIRCMRIARWINKPTDTHSSYFLMLFYGNIVYVNAFNCYLYVYCQFCYLLSYDSIEFHCHRSGMSEDAECQGLAICDLWNTSLSVATHCSLTMQWRRAEDFLSDHVPCWNE